MTFKDSSAKIKDIGDHNGSENKEQKTALYELEDHVIPPDLERYIRVSFQVFKFYVYY